MLNISGIYIPFTNAIYLNVTVVEDVAEEGLINARGGNAQEGDLLFRCVEQSAIGNDFIVIKLDPVFSDGENFDHQHKNRNDQKARKNSPKGENGKNAFSGNIIRIHNEPLFEFFFSLIIIALFSVICQYRDSFLQKFLQMKKNKEMRKIWSMLNES